MLEFTTRVQLVARTAVEGLFDELGNPVSDAAEPVSLPARLWQRSSTEVGTFTADEYTCLLSHRVQVTAADEIWHEGQRYLVEGQPRALGVPGDTGTANLTVSLRRIQELP